MLTDFEESLTCQLYALGKRNANGANVIVLIVSSLKNIMKDPIEEMEELRIPSIILDNMLIGEAKNACFRKTAEDFWMKNSKTCYRMEILR